MEGYRRTLSRNRRAASPAYIVPSRSSDNAGDNCGHDAMRQLLRLKPLPDGVFCYNDPIAIGALRAVLEQGLRVPEDIAIVGCGNIHHAAFVRVPLTSIDQDSAGIGEKAAEMALGMIETRKPPVKPKTVLLHPTLIVRDSTRRE